MKKLEKNADNFKLSFNPDWLKVIKKDFPDFDEKVSEDFNITNKQETLLEPKFNISIPYKFVSEQDFIEINSDYQKRFDNFAKRFPEAVSSSSQRMIIFSKAGFNENVSQAVVFVEIWNDRRSYFFLKKEDCQWKVARENVTGVH